MTIKSSRRLVRGPVIEILAILVIVMGGVAAMWHRWHVVAAREAPVNPMAVQTLPNTPMSIAGLPKKGDASAAVVFVELSDFQCPFCGALARDSMPSFEAKYISSGRVQLIFRQLPLAAIHPSARKAAEISACADQQGRFWEVHDFLFSHQKDLASIVASEAPAGLTASALIKCLVTSGPQRVDEDIAQARSLGISGTPTFLVGHLSASSTVILTEQMTGLQNADQLGMAAERALGGARTVKH